MHHTGEEPDSRSSRPDAHGCVRVRPDQPDRAGRVEVIAVAKCATTCPPKRLRRVLGACLTGLMTASGPPRRLLLLACVIAAMPVHPAELAMTLSGEVRLLDGRPCSGCEVSVYSENVGVRRVRTTATGRFLLSNLPASTYDLFVAGPDGRILSSTDPADPLNQNRRQVVVEEGINLSGLVLAAPPPAPLDEDILASISAEQPIGLTGASPGPAITASDTRASATARFDNLNAASHGVVAGNAFPGCLGRGALAATGAVQLSGEDKRQVAVGGETKAEPRDDDTRPVAPTPPSAPCPPPRVDESDISPIAPPPLTPAIAAIEQARARRYPAGDGTLENTPCGMAIEFVHPKPVEAFPTADSDRIVLGTVTALQTHFSADRGRLYTEFTVEVEEGLKGWPLEDAEPLLVEREGGWLRLPSGRVLADVPQDLGRPEIGRRYLLFLRSNSEGDHSIVQAYELNEGSIEPLNPLKKELPGAVTRSEESLLQAVRKTLP